ncbi:hypothetical protein DQ04_00551170 [Trypanosoma grayi]|uniref:hypothetical protein n=1 Tax=Trypanosoma grayi TaxID=71804 RepID=UPI0004F4BDFE|nr:hypothetical protein DQ04_00551170 [Trypanosoma grayi]KEG14265.1 hypothetical protein DQ04_00551170 [Trypanosoma grayi]
MTNRGFNAAAARNRQHYLQLLRESAGETVSRATVLSCNKSTWSALHRIRSHDANLHLPEKWVQTSSTRLQTSLEGVVPQEKFLNNDLFLCALIHPSYVRSRIARAAVAMPIELTLTGSSTLRLLKEVATAHGRMEFLQTREIADIPRALGVEDLVLYDKAMFAVDRLSKEGDDESSSNNINRNPPEEVQLAAATALCGAVALAEGVPSVALLLDRLLLPPLRRRRGKEAR